MTDFLKNFYELASATAPCVKTSSRAEQLEGQLRAELDQPALGLLDEYEMACFERDELELRAFFYHVLAIGIELGRLTLN